MSVDLELAPKQKLHHRVKSLSGTGPGGLRNSSDPGCIISGNMPG